MTVFHDRIDKYDEERLAQLHRLTIPGALVARLGLKYAQAFYHFIGTSNKEILCVCRGEERTILAASVITLDSMGFDRRLVMGTSLLLWAVVRPWRLPLRHLVWDLVSGRASLANRRNCAELLFLFVDPLYQGRGFGSRLIEVGETALKDQTINYYRVRTEDIPSNRALQFYERRGFHSIGTVKRYGIKFRLFEKHFR
jgi:GNAT superfamily N-acetyltransferase